MRKDISTLGDLIGKVVQIYPGDTYSKWGRIIEISDSGILFEITDADDRCTGYTVGSYRFIAYSANLTFKY